MKRRFIVHAMMFLRYVHDVITSLLGSEQECNHKLVRIHNLSMNVPSVTFVEEYSRSTPAKWSGVAPFWCRTFPVLIGFNPFRHYSVSVAATPES